MATRTIANGGGNWSSTGTWVEGAVPTSADEVVATATSGNVTIDAASSCRSLNLTGYTSTITHNAFALVIGDGTAPTGGVAFKQVGTWTLGSASATITFTSSAAGTHTVDLNSKTYGNLTFNNTASYQMTSNFTLFAHNNTLTLTNGTLDLNGVTWSGGRFATTGTSARTITLGSSKILLTSNAAGNGWVYTGSNLTITANTASVCFVSPSTTTDFIGNGADWNGLSLIVSGGVGTFTMQGSNTLKDLIILPTGITKTVTFTAGTTTTVTGTLLIAGSPARLVTLASSSTSNATITKTSGTGSFYGCVTSYITFNGGATFKTNFQDPTSAGWLACSGISVDEQNYNQRFYLDYEGGSDSTSATPLGWWSVDFTNGSGVMPVEGETVTGGSSGSTAKLSCFPIISSGAWPAGTAAGTMYFYGKSATFSSETVNCGGGGSFSIAGDFTYCPWKTVTSGATAARMSPSDIVRILRSPSPTGMSSATWTSLSKTVTITAMTSVSFGASATTVVRATKASHNLTTGDVVTVSSSTDYDGSYPVTVISSSTFDLVGTTYGVDRTGTVTPAFTKTIDNCETQWATVAGSDVTPLRVAVATDGKEGSYSMKFTTDASTQASILQSYYATGTLNLSLYQGITFWIKNEAAIADATTWVIKLCSDTAGVTEVDKFIIPAIPAAASWVPLTIMKSGGGNLGSSIQSIALYSGATTPAASKYIYLDNINACTTSGLNLQSLISKNSAEQGGTESWYAIQSIVGNTLLIDSYASKGNAGKGYWSSTTPETINTYRRETIKTTMGTSSASYIHTANEAGSYTAGFEQYQGGYNITTNLQSGETFYDGLNCSSGCFSCGNKIYLKLNYLNGVRYYYAFIFQSSAYTEVNFIRVICNYGGVYLVSSNSLFGTIIGTNNQYAIIEATSDPSGTNYGTCILNSNLERGVWGNNARNITGNFTCNNNTLGLLTGWNNSLITVNTVDNSSAGISVIPGANFNLINSTFAESVEVSGNGAAGVNYGIVYSHRHDNTDNNNWVFLDSSSTANTQTSVRHTDSGVAWKINPKTSSLTAVNPSKLPVAKIACNAGSLVTVKAYLRRSNTGLTLGIICPAGSAAGITSDAVSYCSASADTWQEVTITFTPTETTAVPIYLLAYGGTTYSGYIDDMTITQA